MTGDGRNRPLPNLALFDFDGTITSTDTFVPFLERAVAPWRLALGKVALSPLIAAYRWGALPATKVRAAVAGFGFRGCDEAVARAAGAAFAHGFLPTVMRASAVDRLRWHAAEGDAIVVVSAALDLYLAPWCRAQGFALICTEMEARAGVLTGRYRGGDCTGAEKARRVRAQYELAAYPVIYAYGDTPEDAALLALASRRFYRGVEVSKDGSSGA